MYSEEQYVRSLEQYWRSFGGKVFVLPQKLCLKYGVKAAKFLTHIHHGIEKKCGEFHEDRQWIGGTYEQWSEQLCISDRTLRRIVKQLTDEGVILVKKLSRRDRTNFYTIDYGAL
jgi:hypothetical protein